MLPRQHGPSVGRMHQNSLISLVSRGSGTAPVVSHSLSSKALFSSKALLSLRFTLSVYLFPCLESFGLSVWGFGLTAVGKSDQTDLLVAAGGFPLKNLYDFAKKCTDDASSPAFAVPGTSAKGVQICMSSFRMSLLAYQSHINHISSTVSPSPNLSGLRIARRHR